MSRTSTTHFPSPSTHPSRCVGDHQSSAPIAVARPCTIVTAGQLLVYARAAVREAGSAKQRAELATRLGHLHDELLARVERSDAAVLYARAFEALHFGAAIGDAAPDVDHHGVLAALVELSNIILDLCGPCRADARARRRRGIVRRGDGYPLVQPHAQEGARIYRLIDEREYVALPCTRYKIRDWDELLHVVIGPTADCGDGRISRDVLRAFLGLGLASLYKRCEALTEERRRGRFADWPYPTRMPGLVAPGSREDIAVDVVELLRTLRFGPPPSAPDDEPPPATPALPQLPAAPFLRDEVEDEGTLHITEVAQLPLARACEVAL